MVLCIVKVKVVLAHRSFNYCGRNNLCLYIENYDIVRLSGFVFMVLCAVVLMKTFNSTEIASFYHSDFKLSKNKSEGVG